MGTPCGGLLSLPEPLLPFMFFCLGPCLKLIITGFLLNAFMGVSVHGHLFICVTSSNSSSGSSNSNNSSSNSVLLTGPTPVQRSSCRMGEWWPQGEPEVWGAYARGLGRCTVRRVDRIAIGVVEEELGDRERTWVPGLRACVWAWEVHSSSWHGQVVGRWWNHEENRWEVTVQVLDCWGEIRWFVEVVAGGLAGA